MTYVQILKLLLVAGFVPSVALLWLSHPRTFRDIWRSADGALGLGFGADTGRRLWLLAGPYGQSPTLLSLGNQIFSIVLLVIVVLCIWARLANRVAEKQRIKGTQMMEGKRYDRRNI